MATMKGNNIIVCETLMRLRLGAALAWGRNEHDEYIALTRQEIEHMVSCPVCAVPRGEVQIDEGLLGELWPGVVVK